MGCTQAEILRLLELVEDEVFLRKPKNMREAYKRFLRIKFMIREKSIEELKVALGF